MIITDIKQFEGINVIKSPSESLTTTSSEVSAELVETIMHKLGTTSSIEELVESYNTKLPIGCPVNLMGIAPLLMQRIGANFQNALKESSFRGVMFLPVCLLNTSILSYLKVCVPSAGSDWLFLNFHHPLGLGIVFVDEVVS